MVKSILSYLIFLALVIYFVFYQQSSWLLYLPVIISLAFLAVFAGSFFQDKCYVERIAYAIDPKLPPEGRKYCRKVNFIWCMFFVLNAGIAFWTAQHSIQYWTLYNCFISYIIMGLIFAVEYIVRRRVISKLKSKEMLLCLLLIQPCLFIRPVFAEGQDYVSIYKQEESSLEAVQAFSEKFQSIHALRSTFTQTKTINGLTKPIISNGKFVFSRQLGIYWEIEKPLSSVFLISDKGLLKKVSGQSNSFTPATEDRFVLGFTKVFLGLFNADFTDLVKIFSVHLKEDTSGYWQIGLIARSQQTAKFISKIILEGKSFIEKIIIFDPGNDRTEIVFNGLQTEPAELTLEEKNLFAQNG